MLLEYYRTESFRQLAAAQAEEEGYPAALAEAETKYRSGEKPAPTKSAVRGAAKKSSFSPANDEEIESPDLPLWLLDPWVTTWVKMEPVLATEDLRPYFYFSRDVLGPLGTATQRMSTAAQEVFRKLMSPSDAERKLALNRATGIAPADASAVFEALAEKVREEDDFGSDSAAFLRAIEWVKARRDLVGQLAPLLASLPEDRIPPATPVKLLEMAAKNPADPIAKLLAQWSMSKNLALEAATEQATKRLAR